MLIPYRVKNPVKSFPFLTVAIIAINVVVYVFNCDSSLSIREGVVKDYGFAFGASPFINFLWACFLHADIFHLAGNMLFLWVFGPPVEDRLGKISYLIIYFTTGLAGDILQAIFDRAGMGHALVGIGASGCIMGIVGAYWYIFSWSKVCVFYWLGWLWHGVWEVAAIWIVGLYVLMDVAEGALTHSVGVSGGVANFAHVGGAVVGALMCMAMRVQRDTEAVSEAKAIQADTKDLSLMPLHALQTMLDDDPGNPDYIRAMIPAALSLHQEPVIHKAMSQAGPGLIDKSPSLVVHYLIDMAGDATIYQPVHILRLAGMLERDGDPPKALHLYKLIVTAHSTSPDAEMALYRMAQCYWRVFKDARSARACLTEMDQRYPNGAMSQYGRLMMRDLPQ